MKSFSLRRTILLISVLMVFTLSGCRSTVKSEDFSANKRMSLKKGIPSPFHGMLITFQDYEYFLRLENYAEQNDIIP